MFIKGFPYIFIYTPFLHIYSPVVNISATSLVPPHNLVPLSWRNRLKNHELSLLYDRRSNVTMWKSPQFTPMFIRGFNYIFHCLYILWCLRHTWWSPIIPGAFSCFIHAFWCFFPTWLPTTTKHKFGVNINHCLWNPLFRTHNHIKFNIYIGGKKSILQIPRNPSNLSNPSD